MMLALKKVLLNSYKANLNFRVTTLKETSETNFSIVSNPVYLLL